MANGQDNFVQLVIAKLKLLTGFAISDEQVERAITLANQEQPIPVPEEEEAEVEAAPVEEEDALAEEAEMITEEPQDLPADPGLLQEE